MPSYRHVQRLNLLIESLEDIDAVHLAVEIADSIIISEPLRRSIRVIKEACEGVQQWGDAPVLDAKHRIQTWLGGEENHAARLIGLLGPNGEDPRVILDRVICVAQGVHVQTDGGGDEVSVLLAEDAFLVRCIDRIASFLSDKEEAQMSSHVGVDLGIETKVMIAILRAPAHSVERIVFVGTEDEIRKEVTKFSDDGDVYDVYDATLLGSITTKEHREMVAVKSWRTNG